MTAPLRLTVIGCAAAYTLRPWASSSYLIEHGDAAIVLDLGHGAFGNLGAVREPSTLRGVFISHLHPDHNADLVALRHYLKFMRNGAQVPLHAPADIRARFDAYLAEPGFLDELPGEGLQVGDVNVGPFHVRVERVTHTESSFGFRVAVDDAAPGLVYSGDCGAVDDLVALVRPGDTLLAEASFGDREPIEGVAHLTARQAAEAARRGGAAALVLTHVLPEADLGASVRIATDTFPDGEVILAVPGLRVDVPGRLSTR